MRGLMFKPGFIKVISVLPLSKANLNSVPSSMPIVSTIYQAFGLTIWVT